MKRMNFLPAVLTFAAAFPHLMCAADIPFEHMVIDTSVKDPWGKIIVDIDNDGFCDIAIAGRRGPLVWFAYPHWKKSLIAKGGYKTVDGVAGDIDGDGDNDIVLGGLFWYENPLLNPPRSSGDGWKSHRVADHPTHDLALADLDGDGRLDIITRDQSEFGSKAGDKVFLWQQKEEDRWVRHIIECPHGEGLAAADIDNDGDADVVVGALWFENTGTVAGEEWAAHEIADWHRNATVQVADINKDGRLDVILSPSELKGQTYRLSWFEAPQDPTTAGWTEHVIVDSIECVIHGLAAADFNSDGLVDVAISEMHQGRDPDEVALFINKTAGTAWTRQVLSSKGSHYIQAGDIDADGDVDLVGANWSGPYQPVEIWRNTLKQ